VRQSWLERPGFRLPAALALLALAVRVLRWWWTAVMMNDGPVFLRLAQQMANGEWRAALTYEFHPLYPFMVRVVQPLFGDWERAAVAVSAVAGAIAVVGLFVLLRDAFDRRVGAIGALLLAVHPIAIEQSDVQSDALYFAFFVWSAALLWRAVSRGSARAAFGAGLLSGLAYLVRPEGMGALIVGVALVGFELARRHMAVSAAARVAGALCLGAALTMSPYIAFLSVENGTLTITEKKSVAGVLGLSALRAWATHGTVEYKPPKPVDPLLAARPDLQPLARGSRPFREKPVTTGLAKYPEALARLAGVTLKTLRTEITLLLLLGLVSVRGRPELRGRFFLAFAGLYLFVLLGLSANSAYVSRRHVFPPAALQFGYAALGVLFVGAGLARAPGLRGRVSPPAAVTSVLVLVVALGLGKALGPDRDNSLAERRAAEWVGAQGALAPDDAVAAVKQRVAYYAGSRFVDLRHAPHPALLLPYLRRERARYVIVDDRERTVLESLVGEERDAVVLRHEEHGAGDAFVYEVH
jgi:4-amino-4-deoxy-L-arabinose transferase-like glycosyltransferase